MSLQPKEPEKEAGREARQAYLQFARSVVGEPNLDYTKLYQRFAQNDWAAIKLDDSVAIAALKSGHSATEVFRFLHQSPYMQYQIHEKQVAVSVMSRYAESTVRQAMQQAKGTQVTQTHQNREQTRQPEQDLER